ncbi:MAG TPA: Flp family type IVb pilin [Ktedonobacterales bacterium]|nr:Flp family type IVb pilin [Ktedonobacterales bacterium]
MSNQSLLPFDDQENLPIVHDDSVVAPEEHRSERGQGLVEYALIIALVAIVVIAALILLGPAIASTFNNITNSL